MENSYVYATCDACGTSFEGDTSVNEEGQVRCPICNNQTQNWNSEAWVDETPKEILKLI